MKGFIPLFTASIIFSLFGVIATELSKSISVFQTLFAVSLIQTAGFFLLMISKKISFKIHRHLILNVIAFSAINLCAILFFNLAVSKEKIGLVLVIQNASTLIFSFIVSKYFLKVKSNAIELGLIIIISLGIATIYLPLGISNLSGAFLGLLVGISNVIANLFRKNLSNMMHPLQLSFYYSFISLFIIGFALYTSAQSAIPELNQGSLTLIVIYAALNIITTLLLIKGFQTINFNMGNIILSMEIIFGLLIGFLFLGQEIQYNQFTGSLTIFIALVIIRIKQIEDSKPVSISTSEETPH